MLYLHHVYLLHATGQPVHTKLFYTAGLIILSLATYTTTELTQSELISFSMQTMYRYVKHEDNPTVSLRRRPNAHPRFCITVHRKLGNTLCTLCHSLMGVSFESSPRRQSCHHVWARCTNCSQTVCHAALSTLLHAVACSSHRCNSARSSRTRV